MAVLTIHSDFGAQENKEKEGLGRMPVLQGWLSGSTDTWRPHLQDVEFFPSHALRQSNIPQVPPTSSVLSSYSPLDPHQHWKLPSVLNSLQRPLLLHHPGDWGRFETNHILKYWSQVQLRDHLPWNHLEICYVCRFLTPIPQLANSDFLWVCLIFFF